MTSIRLMIAVVLTAFGTVSTAAAAPEVQDGPGGRGTARRPVQRPLGGVHAWPALRRQVCWAHLKRDFQKWWTAAATGRGRQSRAEGRAAGVRGVAPVPGRRHRPGDAERAAGSGRGAQLIGVLEGGCGCADAKVAAFCANVLAMVPALWRFVVTEGMEPTNNHAERLLRRGVLWRKNAFGCHSAEGCRFVERMLTVVQTLRLQGRSVLATCMRRWWHIAQAHLSRNYSQPAERLPAFLTTDEGPNAQATQCHPMQGIELAGPPETTPAVRPAGVVPPAPVAAKGPYALARWIRAASAAPRHCPKAAAD